MQYIFTSSLSYVGLIKKEWRVRRLKGCIEAKHFSQILMLTVGTQVIIILLISMTNSRLGLIMFFNILQNLYQIFYRKNEDLSVDIISGFPKKKIYFLRLPLRLKDTERPEIMVKLFSFYPTSKIAILRQNQNFDYFFHFVLHLNYSETIFDLRRF